MVTLQTEMEAELPSVAYMGLQFNPLTIDAAVEAIMAASGPFRYVTTPNVQHLVNWIDHPEEFGPLYKDAWMSLCDGRLLPALARLSGLRVPSASGSDLTERLIPIMARERIPITIIGPGPSDIATLKARYPGLIVNSYSPPFGFMERTEEVQACLDFILNHPARFVFLAVGTPRQELLARRLLKDGRATGVGLCIGASIDFLVGRQIRAPRWMQVAYLEWFHRMMQDPHRLAGRYLIHNPRIFLHIWRFERSRRREQVAARKSPTSR